MIDKRRRARRLVTTHDDRGQRISMVNVNIEIPDELHKCLKLAAVMDGTTIKQLVIDILSEEDRKGK